MSERPVMRFEPDKLKHKIIAQGQYSTVIIRGICTIGAQGAAVVHYC